MDDQEVAKQQALDEWVRAVNAHGGFRRWRSAVAGRPGEVLGVLGSDMDPAS